MAVYRAVNDLACGNKPGARGGILYAGSLTRLEWLGADGIARLLDVGAVSRVATPPLAALPGWKVRAGKLQQIGIVTVEDLIEADIAEVKAHMEVMRESTVEKWIQEARDAILVSAVPRRGK